MVKYICEKCGKTFKQKCHYTKHLQRKTPCNKNLNKKKLPVSSMRMWNPFGTTLETDLEMLQPGLK